MHRASQKSQTESGSKISLHKFDSPFRDLSTTCFEHKSKTQYLKQFTTILKPERSSTLPQTELIFEPEIHDLPLQLYPERQQQFKKSKEEIFERLIQNKTKKITERLSAKVEEQKKKIKQCTFQPTISEFQIPQQQNQNVFDRLYENAKDREELFHEKQKQKEEKEEEETKKLRKDNKFMKFLNNEKHCMVPLHQRLNDIVRKKLQQKKQLQEKYNQQHNLSFKPEVNENSKNLVQENIEKDKLKKNVVERLLNEYKKNQQSKENLRKKFQNLEKIQFTFKPSINNNFIHFSNTETSRLKQNVSKCSHDDQSFTFAPKINHLSNLIVKHNRGEEQQEQKLKRLAYEPIEQKVNSLQRIKKQTYAECTFNPEINQISANLDAKPRNHCCYQPKQQVYSFKPEINQKSRLIRSNSVETTRIKQSKRKQKYKFDEQYDQMKQCTFKPRINNYRHKGAKQLGEVEGVPTYMEKIDKIRSMKELKKIREEKIFNFEKKYDKRMGLTASSQIE